MTVRTTATAGELLEAWFAFATPDFSPKTVKETRWIIDRSLMPTLGSTPLAKLKPADLDALYRRLLASVIWRPAAGASTARRSTASFAGRSIRA